MEKPGIIPTDSTGHKIPPKHGYRVKNERMGGFVPSWDKPTEHKKAFMPAHGVNSTLSSYQKIEEPPDIIPQSAEEEFGFLDLVDIVNPLQHVPLVNMAYRKITGDEIRPIGKIVGGGLYGGPAGAASGLVHIVIEEETGKDLFENTANFARKTPTFQEEKKTYEDLPIALLEFAQTPINKSGDDTIKTDEKNGRRTARIAGGRTAGSIAVYS